MRYYEFIIEARTDFIADQLGDKLLQAYTRDGGLTPNLETPLDIVNELAKASQKAIQWLANRYIAGEFKLEDIPRVKQDLMKFAQVQSKLPLEQKDLNRLSLSDLYKVLKPFEKKAVVSNRAEDRAIKEKLMKTGKAEMLYKDNNLIVLIPKTKAASCYFGKGTKWCTSATNQNMFAHYNKRGQLYIIMTKDDGKYQFQFETNSYMNSEDQPLTDDQLSALTQKYPKLYDIFSKQAEEHLFLQLIKNPSEEIQIAAVQADVENIQLIKNPSEEIQTVIVSTNGAAIRFLKNPTEEIQIIAVKQDGLALAEIKNPSEKVQLAAVDNAPGMIETIKNPSEKVQLVAIKQDYSVIYDIENPSKKAQKLARELHIAAENR